MPFDPSIYMEGAWNTPASSSKAMRNYMSSTSTGISILSAAGYPKRNYPTAANLGLDMLDSAATSVFPFKSNNIALTEIEVPTTILVLGGANKNEIIYQTNKFILQSIIKPQQERFQIIETFGEPSLYFYDKRTRIYTIQGVLFDGEDVGQLDNPGTTEREQLRKGVNYWATAFQDFYETALRGTILAQKGWIAALYINNWFIKGYPLQLTITKNSDALPQTAGFQMTWAIKSETLLSSKAAQALWSKNRYNKATADAYNFYLGALSTYNDAYNAYSNADKSIQPAIFMDESKDLTKLSKAMEKARVACDAAYRNVKIAIQNDINAQASATSGKTK